MHDSAQRDPILGRHQVQLSLKRARLYNDSKNLINAARSAAESADT